MVSASHVAASSVSFINRIFSICQACQRGVGRKALCWEKPSLTPWPGQRLSVTAAFPSHWDGLFATQWSVMLIRASALLRAGGIELV